LVGVVVGDPVIGEALAVTPEDVSVLGVATVACGEAALVFGGVDGVGDPGGVVGDALAARAPDDRDELELVPLVEVAI
jgi:hypothetical protein